MKKVPLDPSAYPPVVWLRDSDEPQILYLALTISPAGFIIADRHSLVQIPTMEIVRWEHSEDRKDWKPCYREVE